VNGADVALDEDVAAAVPGLRGDSVYADADDSGAGGCPTRREWPLILPLESPAARARSWTMLEMALPEMGSSEGRPPRRPAKGGPGAVPRRRARRRARRWGRSARADRGRCRPPVRGPLGRS
jgi:hypothetical protein